jgi:hypothetical protein
VSKRDLKFLQRVSALVYPVETRIWLTTSDWSAIACEVAALRDPGTPLPMPGNFQRLQLGKLTALHAGTDDQVVCDALNEPEERKANFRAKHDRFAIRASDKKDPIEYVDVESTHEMPEELRKAALEKLEATGSLA